MRTKYGWAGMTAAISAAAGVVAYSGSASAACTLPSSPDAAVVVLLDRSGSMASDGSCSGVKRKWECGVNDAHKWIADNDPYGNRVYFIWQFATMGDPEVMTTQDNNGGSGYCLSDAYDKLAPVGDLVGPTVDDASTPLAGAYCQAVQFLKAYRSTVREDLPLYIKLESDGLENSTPADADCAGFTGGTADFVPHFNASTNTPVELLPAGAPTTADGLLLGSWESYMYDTGISGVFHPFPPLDPNAFKAPADQLEPTAVINNVTAIHDYIPPAMMSLNAQALRVQSTGSDGFMSRANTLFAAASLSTSTAAATATTAATTADPLTTFLGGLAQVTGGRAISIGDGSVPDPNSAYGYHVIAGDVNDSGCVDATDFNLIKQSYGQLALPSNLNAVRADLSADGLVNVADYLVLSAHYGEGCSTTPGSVPVLGNALFGFEDLAKWSSVQAPLSATTQKHSEGSYSLLIGGSGWREVKSVNFSTALFQGVTSKIALDVLIPTQLSNPYWAGQVLLFVNVPSAGILNYSLGNFELTGKPRNTFIKAQFNLPTAVRNAMKTAHSDFSFKIALNANDPNYEIDNLRFVQ